LGVSGTLVKALAVRTAFEVFHQLKFEMTFAGARRRRIMSLGDQWNLSILGDRRELQVT
jgi:hypothetical protein